MSQLKYNEDLSARLSQVEQERDGLKKYVVHGWQCEARVERTHFSNGPCTCGLDALLSGAPQQESAPAPRSVPEGPTDEELVAEARAIYRQVMSEYDALGPLASVPDAAHQGALGAVVRHVRRAASRCQAGPTEDDELFKDIEPVDSI